MGQNPEHLKAFAHEFRLMVQLADRVLGQERCLAGFDKMIENPDGTDESIWRRWLKGKLPSATRAAFLCEFLMSEPEFVSELGKQGRESDAEAIFSLMMTLDSDFVSETKEWIESYERDCEKLKKVMSIVRRRAPTAFEPLQDEIARMEKWLAAYKSKNQLIIAEIYLERANHCYFEALRNENFGPYANCHSKEEEESQELRIVNYSVPVNDTNTCPEGSYLQPIPDKN